MRRMNEEMKRWMREHFANMVEGGIWMPESAGVTYQKKDSKTLSLIRLVDSEGVRDNHERIKAVAWDLGYTVKDDEAEIVPGPSSQIEAQVQELEMKRKVAQGWADEDGTLLIDMNVDAVYPRFVEDREVLLDNGDTTSVEIWEYSLLNPNTEETLSIDPDDYCLLMGDDRYMQYMNENGELLIALSRAEMVKAIDEGDNGVIIGTTDPHTGERVPPWMYGTYCAVVSTPGEKK